jgi:transposase
MYRTTRCPRTRLRIQMVLLSQQGYAVAEIARITHQSDDAVRYWLHRFLREGCAGLWEAPRSGRPPKITPAIELFLREAVVKSPRDYGLAQPNWTTHLLSKLIKRRFKRKVSDDCVWQHLRDVGGVCRRPTWSVKHRAQAQPGYAQKKARLPGF